MTTQKEILVQMKEHARNQDKNIRDMKNIVGELSDNIRQINDANILHHTESKNKLNSIYNTIMLLSGKYFWLIVIMIFAFLIVAGFGDQLTKIPFL